MTHGLTTVFVGENIDNMGCVQDNLLLIGRILGYRHRNRPYLLEEDSLGITNNSHWVNFIKYLWNPVLLCKIILDNFNSSLFDQSWLDLRLW